MRFVLAVLLVSFPAADAAAQDYPAPSFSDLRMLIRPGQRLIVKDDGGGTSRGELASLTADHLELTWRNWHFQRKRQSFSGDSVRSIAITDSTWNGELVGLAIGLVAGIVAENRCNSESCLAPAITTLVFAPPAGYAIGRAIDWSINRVIYQSSRRHQAGFGPLAGPNHIGGMIRFEF